MKINQTRGNLLLISAPSLILTLKFLSFHGSLLFFIFGLANLVFVAISVNDIEVTELMFPEQPLEQEHPNPEKQVRF